MGAPEVFSLLRRSLIRLPGPSLKPLLRRLVVTQYPTITFFHGTVTSLLASPLSAQDALSGVRLHLPNGSDTTLDAVFVLDATCPVSAGTKMLSRLSAKIAVPKTSYLPGLQYCTSIFPISEMTKQAIGDPGLLLEPTGKKRWEEVAFVALVTPQFHLGNRFGFIFDALEGDRGALFPPSSIGD